MQALVAVAVQMTSNIAFCLGLCCQLTLKHLKIGDLASVRYITILVYSGCYTKTPQTGWFINNKYLFLTVLEAGNFKRFGV